MTTRKLYRTPIGVYMNQADSPFGKMALACDMYGLTMAYAWYRAGELKRRAVFDYFFRTTPYGGSYAVGMGLAALLEFYQAVRFTDDDIEYLMTLKGNDGKLLFPDEGFFMLLKNMKLEIAIDAMPEGSLVFPRQPMVRFTGPAWQIQLFEGFVLNQLNFWTLIGTKTARMVVAARGKPISESGFRRGQGIDGHLTAALAAYCAGAAGTSNMLAGKLFGMPTYGTMAHSFVTYFPTEGESFTRFADALPNNSLFLVDTYDTLTGVKVAIEVMRVLKARGHKARGIRLDSGDLAWLSAQARKLLDEAGFSEAAIVASNDLDEFKIEALEREGARVEIYAPGTALATGGNQAALGGVLKLVAVENDDGTWGDRIKLSADSVKITIPGKKNVRRYRDASGKYIGDAMYDESTPPTHGVLIVNPNDAAASKWIPAGTAYEDMLKRVFENCAVVGGSVVGEIESIQTVRERVASELKRLDAAHLRLKDAHPYPAGLTQALHEKVLRAIATARKTAA